MNDNTNPAATSGDAPELQQLKALALAATPGPWHVTKYCSVMDQDMDTLVASSDSSNEDRAFIAAANPAVVLGLIARIESLNTSFELARANYEQVVEKNAELNARIERITAHVQPVNTSSERVENAAGNEQIERAASGATASGDELTTVECPTCNGHGLIGGHSGQTPESYEEHTQGCDDCDGQGRVIVSRADLAAVSAATKPTADQSKVPVVAYTKVVYQGWPEYNRTNEFSDGSSDGAALVKLADVQSLLATKPAAAPEVPVELMGVRQEIEAGSGFWHTCSGCHESEDGHPVGRYHYSEAMSCELGTGCSECGGIGAVWDNNDYDAMAADWDKPDAASTIGAAQTAGQVRTSDLEAVVKFLMGEAPLEGVEFGEKHPTKAGAYWWRLNLRAAWQGARK